MVCHVLHEDKLFDKIQVFSALRRLGLSLVALGIVELVDQCLMYGYHWRRLGRSRRAGDWIISADSELDHFGYLKHLKGRASLPNRRGGGTTEMVLVSR